MDGGESRPLGPRVPSLSPGDGVLRRGCPQRRRPIGPRRRTDDVLCHGSGHKRCADAKGSGVHATICSIAFVVPVVERLA